MLWCYFVLLLICFTVFSDRIFSYYAGAFKSGNCTLEQLLKNIELSYIDKIDNLSPETELNDENWAIDFWMKKHMLGLHYLHEYHGFEIARYEELGKEEPEEGSVIPEEDRKFIVSTKLPGVVWSIVVVGGDMGGYYTPTKIWTFFDFDPPNWPICLSSVEFIV